MVNSIEKRIRGALLALLLFLSSALGIMFLPGWFLPIAFLSPWIYRIVADTALAWWFYYASALLEFLLGIKVVISGDEIRPNERNLLIMNHRTRLDWMYLWSVLVRQSGVKTEKIVLKAPLKNIPGPGWAMQCGAFIFINRKWEEDKLIFSNMVEYFADLRHKTQIMLFPEGTDLTPSTKKRSDAFAEKNGVPAYDYVLHPRTTGFTFMVQCMRREKLLDAVYDISIAYPHNFPQKELDLVTGNFPREVHFHIKRHDAATLPTSEEGIESWCRDRWAEKEELLKSFYEHKSFGADIFNPPGSGIERRIWWQLLIAFIFWTSFIIFIIYLLITSGFAQIHMLIQIVFFVVMTKWKGFDLYQATYHLSHFKGTKSPHKSS